MFKIFNLNLSIALLKGIILLKKEKGDFILLEDTAPIEILSSEYTQIDFTEIKTSYIDGQV